MRALLDRYAPAIYIGGGLALLLGAAVALFASSLAGTAVGFALSSLGLAGMGSVHGRVGA